MERIWQIIPHDEELVERLETTAKVSPIIAQLLASRGIHHPDLIKRFLNASMTQLHDPSLLPHVGNAAEIVHQAIKNKQKIVIFGDYDCDGMTGTAILVSGLKLIQADVSYFVPNRLEDGYGLNRDALTALKKRGYDLVITVDCGIASLEEVDYANELGLTVIVTDHHSMRERLPAAAAIVHPKLDDGDYPFPGLCGAGVAFKLIWSIFRQACGDEKVQPHMKKFLVAALGLASIGTVADVVPLLDENRIIVKHGLQSLRNSEHVGIRSLLRVAQLSDKPALASDDIGFSIGPRLNAAGRLGQAQLGVELLTTTSPDRADALADYIDNLNVSRVSLERSVQLAANKQIKEQFDAESDPAFVLDGTGWHAGVIGIVAGRIAEKYHRPTVIISWDKLGAKPGIGSARSAGKLPLSEAFAHCSEHLVSHGGHAAAAGLKIEHAKLDLFRADFLEFCSQEITADERVPLIRIDAEVNFTQLTFSMMQQLDQMEPFGESNPRPRFCASEVELVNEPRKIGKGERHLSLSLKQNGKSIRAVAFGKADWYEPLLQCKGPIDVVFKPVINEFRGMKKIEIQLVDWRDPAAEACSDSRLSKESA